MSLCDLSLFPFKVPSTRIRIFLNPQLFFPDAADVHTHPANSAVNPDIFKSALQRGKNKSAKNPITRGRVNPNIFESDDVANSCPVSDQTINQYGGTTCRPRANRADSCPDLSPFP